jgi:hypothetical protein
MSVRLTEPTGLGAIAFGPPLLAAAAGVVVGIMILSMAVHPAMVNPATFFGGLGPGPSNTAGNNSSGPHLSAAECATEEPNASLIQDVVHLYEGNGNASGSGSGLINQGPPGPSAYPSESVAESNVINGWLAVCESSAYYTLVGQWGAPNYPINANAQNQSGVYEEVAAVTWQAPASSCVPTSNPGGPCMGTAEWLINVASGEVSGPKTSFYVIQAPI